jgi:sulfur dioxygenase
MIFNQLFDNKSSTYTYIISSGKGREALIIDPVIEHTNKYIKILKDLKLRLVKVIDTHIHADHVSGLNELNKETKCTRIMGEKSESEVIDIRVKDNEKIKIENIELTTIYTPGHTECSYSYLMNDRVFTGDTLLINGSGRTDFQGGNAKDQYNSIFERLLKLPKKTLVYPAHDYNGEKFSTIENEKNNNPRLQVNSPDEYIEIMNNLKIANPKMMDVAVPANKKGFFLKEALKLDN